MSNEVHWQYSAECEGDNIVVEPSYQDEGAAFIEVYEKPFAVSSIWLTPEQTLDLRDHLTAIIEGRVTYEQ